jgi:hypothetical protein
MKSRWTITVLLLSASAILVVCTRDYNPFADLTNAKAHVLAWTFADRDSVPLYSTGRLELVVALREEVDSVVVIAEKNRYWSDTTIRRNSIVVPIEGGPYYFDISFYDTGRQHVSVKTYRSNGEMFPQEFSVSVYNPLRQAMINGFFGVATLLATPPVTDNGVFYQWDFGAGRLERWPSDTHAVIFPYSAVSSGRGSLQVTDLSGKHGTPPCFFSYSFNDTSAPVILCVNDGLTNDTLKVSDSLLAFKAYIADLGMGNNAVDFCSINQDAFDFVNTKTHVYTKVYKNLPGLTAGNVPLRITVVAIDNLQFSNKTQDTFWVVYDPQGIKSPDANLRFISPSKDPSYSMVRLCRTVGIAENYRGEEMVLSIRVNDSLYPATQVIYGGTGNWQWLAYLDTIVNTITVSCRSSADNRLLTYEQITVIYSPGAIDTVKPMIYEIVTPDGKHAGNLHLIQESTTLKIVAFDEGTEIRELTVNGTPVEPDSTGYCWYWNSGTLVHSGQGNSVSIVAIDQAGNQTDTAITLFRNSMPELVADPAIGADLCIDSGYMFHLSTYDADNDSVTIVTVSAPTAMAISQNGTVFWKPTAADIGRLDSLVIRLSDQYDMTPRYCWKFTCRDCFQPLVPVHFTTREQDFPEVLQANADTLDLRLAIDTAQLPPYTPRYSAWFLDNGQPLLDNDSAGLLIWTPAMADTGYRRLMVTVGDGATWFDTLRPAVRVVPKNQYPCSLSYTFTGSLTPKGELDLFSHPAPETLYFAIHDSDDPRVEQYTVSVVQHNVNTVSTLNERTFFIAIRPDSLLCFDTLWVSIRDLTGTADKVKFIIRYIAWEYKKNVYLNTTAAGAGTTTNVYGFPVLVRLTNNNFTFSQARSSGEDLRFSKPDGTLLPYEIERFDSTFGRAEIWVKVDTVYGSDASQYFVMHWGNPNALDASNPHAVFDTANGFVGVWHLKEGGVGTRYNSAQSSYNATPQHYGNNESKVSLIALGDSLGGNDHLEAGNIELSRALTLSAWVKPMVYTVWGSIIAKQWSLTATDPFQAYVLMMDNQNPAHCQFALSINGTRQWVGSTSTIPLSLWTYLSGTWDGSTMNVYFNGSSQTQKAGMNGAIPAIPATQTTIGENEADATQRLNGVLDEIRIEKVGRSADWIRLCYVNQIAGEANALVTIP